ncbi:MAG: thioredoxin, partial [Senegalia sp. (in: firmicutes)]
SGSRRLAIKQKVLGLPTITIYKDGEKVDELTKEDAKPAKIEDMIKKYI